MLDNRTWLRWFLWSLAFFDVFPSSHHNSHLHLHCSLSWVRARRACRGWEALVMGQCWFLASPKLCGDGNRRCDGAGLWRGGAGRMLSTWVDPVFYPVGTFKTYREDMVTESRMTHKDMLKSALTYPDAVGTSISKKPSLQHLRRNAWSNK